MDLRERINPPFDQVLEIIRRIGMRKTHSRLHRSQDVLCSMLGLAREIDDLILGSFAVCYILEAVDGTDNVAITIGECLDVDERDTARAVRSLNMDFLLAHGDTGPQHVGHRAFMVREQTAVGAEHPIGSAKPLIGIAEFRRSAPKFGSAAVVANNETVRVTNIHGKRELFKKPRGQFERLFLTQIESEIGLSEGLLFVDIERAALLGIPRRHGQYSRMPLPPNARTC